MWFITTRSSDSGDKRLERSKPFQGQSGALNQISQSAEFKALRKPPNAASRQDPGSPAPFERSETIGRLLSVTFVSVAFGFGWGRTAAATFLGLGTCRGWLITLGGSTGPTLTSSGGETGGASDGAMCSSTGAGCGFGCAGGSPLAAAISSRS